MTDPIHHTCQKQTTFVALALILVAFALRVHNLDAQAFSADEAFTVVVWNQGTLTELLTKTSLIDPQPPATLFVVVGWLRMVGTTELAARYLSVLASLIAIASLYQLASLLLGTRVALLSGLLTVVNPLHFWYAQDIRSYSLWMGISAFAMLALLKTLKQPGNFRLRTLYIIVTALGLYTFYLEVFFVVAHNVFAFVVALRKEQARSLLTSWIPAQAIIAILIAPWYLKPVLRNSGYHPTADVIASIPWLFEALSFGATLPPALKAPLLMIGTQHFTIASILAILLSAGGIAVILAANNRNAAWFVAIFSLLPMLLLAILTTSTGLGFFLPRYLAPASLPLILASAALVDYLLTVGRWQAAVGTSLMLLITGISISSTWWYQSREPKSPPWREIAVFLETQLGPDDVIIRNFPDPAFDYYYRGRNDSILLPVELTTPPIQTYDTLTELTHQYDGLWFLPVLYISHDPEQLVAHWLYDNSQLISEHWIDTTHIIQFANWDVDSSKIENQLAIPFAQTAILRGYNITPTQNRWAVGENVSIELFWEPIQQTVPILTVLFHALAVDDSGNITLLTQDDQWPQEGRITTQTWEPGKLYRDVHILTLPDSPGGRITFATGLYNAETLERIPLDPDISSQLLGPDSLILFTFNYP